MGNLTWELLGAVVGAGMASGREIAAFFAQYGSGGLIGAATAATAMGFLANARMPDRWKAGWQAKTWRVLSMLLLIVTGGAMLAGAGEVAALVLPMRGAYLAGVAATLIIALLLAGRTGGGLAWVSRLLLCVFLVMLLVGWLTPPMHAAALGCDSFHDAILKGILYGGFNAALMTPILALSTADAGGRRRSTAAACALLCLLIILAHLTIHRHPALMSEALPFVRMMAQWGRLGMLLAASSLYLAILSTLTACLRGLRCRSVCVAAVLAVSAAGFSDVVGAAYPVLGGACALMLLWMRIVSWRNAL